MSVTSLTMRGVFPGDVREMKNQEQNYNPYADEDSPIDLRKKPAINRQRQSDERHYEEEYIRGDSPALSEEENERRYEFFHAIQKMSSLALPPLIHPWLMVNPKDLSKVGGGIGLHPSVLHGGAGYQAYNAPNPYVLNPLSLAALYPLASEQCGLQYAMANYSNGMHVETLPPRLIPRNSGRSTLDVSKTDQKERNTYQEDLSKDKKTPAESFKEVRGTERDGFVEGQSFHSDEDRNPHSRSASTPPDPEYKNRRKILNIRYLRDSWKSDSKLLASKGMKSQNKNKTRFASDGSLDHAILRLHVKKKCLTSLDKTKTSPLNTSVTGVRRSHSCSDLNQLKQSASSKEASRYRYHCGYSSDNETLHGSPFSSSQCSLYSSSSRKENTIDLGAYKRKSFAPSDDSDMESEKSLLSVGSESPPGKKPFQDAKRLKGLRSLSEPSIRKKVLPASCDYSTPTDLSMKSSPPSEKAPDPSIWHFNHSPQTPMPWGVYGYYNHLLQRFRDQELLKRHSSFSSHDHRKEQYPVGPEAGLSPPPSPSPENYSSMTSSGTWIESSRSGDYGREGSPDSSTLLSDPNNRKRPCRALTGKHVKHGTGASPSTLFTLRQKIQERQKAKELGTTFDKSEPGKSKAGQNRKSQSSRSSKKDKSKQGTKILPSTSLQSKDQSL